MFSKDNKKVITYCTVDLDDDPDFFVKNVKGQDEQLYKRGEDEERGEDGDDDVADLAVDDVPMISPSNSPGKHDVPPEPLMDKENVLESQIDFAA